MKTIPQHFNEPLEIELIEHPEGTLSEVHISQGSDPELMNYSVTMIDTDTIPALMVKLAEIFIERENKYFNEKYPCTTDENSDILPEDKYRWDKLNQILFWVLHKF